jgi:hypothetical protein
MERQHVRAAVLASDNGEALARAFTLKEFIHRATERGPRPYGQALDTWINALHSGRTHRDLLGNSSAYDIPDPVGGPAREIEKTALLLDRLVKEFVRLTWPSPESQTE